MTLKLIAGPNFSGRSAALRAFLLEDSSGRRTHFLHPLLDVNRSGLATTVGGETLLHQLGSTKFISSRYAEVLLGDLDPVQSLRTLSGGETVRHLLACALISGPANLALDCVLEQLDGPTRQRVLSDALIPLGREADVWVADNRPVDIASMFEARTDFAGSRGDADAEALELFAMALNRTAVRAPTIELNDLSFRYGSSRKKIFDRANFVFEPGRPYILRAPNGAGKSTLARLLIGVLRPLQGQFHVNSDLHQPSSSAANLLFYAFQNPAGQIFGRSVISYLTEVEAAARKRPTWLQGDLAVSKNQVLEAFAMSSMADLEPFDLPFVFMKRLTIAASLLSRSSWLFFDEPALASDARNTAALGQLFNALCSAGMGLIIVSHGHEFDGLRNARHITISGGAVGGDTHD